MLVVMSLGASGGYATAGEQAEAVADLKRQPQPVIGQPLLAADIDRQSITLGHRHHLGVAAEPARRSRRKRWPAFHVAAPVARLAGEHADVDMNHHLGCRTRL